MFIKTDDKLIQLIEDDFRELRLYYILNSATEGKIYYLELSYVVGNKLKTTLIKKTDDLEYIKTIKQDITDMFIFKYDKMYCYTPDENKRNGEK